MCGLQHRTDTHDVTSTYASVRNIWCLRLHGPAIFSLFLSIWTLSPAPCPPNAHPNTGPRFSHSSSTRTVHLEFPPFLKRSEDENGLMKSARIWLRGERKQSRVGLLLQGTLRISLSYTYFMVEQSFRTCRLLEQISAAEEPSADNSIHVYSSFARRFIRRRVGACCYKGYQLHPAKQLYIRLWRAHQRTSG